MSSKNKLIHGDCLIALDKIKPESVDLIYLDPPFCSDKKHKLKNRKRTTEFCFDDIWKSNKDYAEFLYLRMVKMREALKESGSIFFHCDKSAEHIVRALLDRVFGENNFQSEIIWYYKRWSNSKKGLLSSHQNIYFYSKSKSFKFNPVYTSYSETTNIDQILQHRTRDSHNKSIYKLDANGKEVVSGKKKGVPLSDVWEIPYLNPKAKERAGYPTQKPLHLLERIIELTTHEGDLILDPFCGSGTTCVAAQLLNRHWIGIDTSQEAIDLAQSRIANPIKTQSTLLEKGRQSYINADLNALGLLNGIKYYPVQRNKGIDAILEEQFKGAPVLVKIQRSNETLVESAELLKSAMQKKGAVKSFLLRTHRNELLESSIEYEGISIINSPSVVLTDSIFESSQKN